jgi:methyl-accepting chemotaxis protein
MKKMRSISTKFIISFLIIGLIPVVIFGLVSYLQLNNTLITDKENALRATAENKLLALEIWMDEIELKGHLIQNIPDFKIYAETLMQESQESNLFQSAHQDLDATLKSMISSQDDYTGIYMISPQGRLKYSLFETEIVASADLSDHDFFKIGQSKFYFSDVMMSPISGKPSFLISAPIADANGVLISVLILEVGLDRMNKIVQSGIGIGDEGKPFLVNGEGKLISSTRFYQFPILTRKFNTKGIKDALMGGTVSGKFLGVNEEEVIGAYVYFESKKWVMAIELPTSEALKSSYMLAFETGVLALVLVVIILVVARRNANSLSNPLISMTKTARLVAEGDLRETVKVQSNDEVGVLAESFNTMVASLASMNRRIMEMAKRIEKTAGEILLSSHDQEEVTLTQSSAVSETTATIEELSISAKQVSQSAQSIMQQVEGTAAKILYLSEKAQEINKITTVIEDVAHQIHLLSLNASIEAARAGENGKGFEVVASEIRKLSEKSNKQTTEIAQIVEDIQNSISSAVLATEQAVNGVRSITLSVQQQDTATDQISVAMQDINQSMRKSIEGTKRTLGGVEELKSVVRTTNDLASQFKLD